MRTLLLSSAFAAAGLISASQLVFAQAYTCPQGYHLCSASKPGQAACCKGNPDAKSSAALPSYRARPGPGGSTTGGGRIVGGSGGGEGGGDSGGSGY